MQVVSMWRGLSKTGVGELVVVRMTRHREANRVPRLSWFRDLQQIPYLGCLVFDGESGVSM